MTQRAARTTATKTLAPTAAKGDQMATLTALRDRLAAQIDQTTSGRYVAALSRQLTDVLGRIEAQKRSKPSKVDELHNRRRQRLAQLSAPREAASDE